MLVHIELCQYKYSAKYVKSEHHRLWKNNCNHAKVLSTNERTPIMKDCMSYNIGQLDRKMTQTELVKFKTTHPNGTMVFKESLKSIIISTQLKLVSFKSLLQLKTRINNQKRKRKWNRNSNSFPNRELKMKEICSLLVTEYKNFILEKIREWQENYEV